MAGSGEVYQRADSKWGFRVRTTDGDTVAVDGGQQFEAKADAEAMLRKVLHGDYDGPVSEAAPVTCGQQITKNTTLHSDLHCASGPALIIAADNITVNLAGHTLSRDSATAGGGGPGILFRGVSGSTVKNGTVQHFDAGIVIDGGGHNVVQHVTAQDNVGSVDGELGDGIVVNNSSENRIEGNTVLRNGPFSGIALGPNSQGNTVRDNVVTDNNMLQTGDPSAGRQDMGIRVEGPGATKNKISANTVTGSGSNGITVHPVCADPNSDPPCVGAPANELNEIAKNTSNRNGTSGRGDGIKLFNVANPVAPTQNTITDNVANDNKTYGISIDDGATKNKATGNSAHGNGAFDGNDGNTSPPCGANVWQSNDFGLVNQPCVQGGPQARPLTLS